MADSLKAKLGALVVNARFYHSVIGETYGWGNVHSGKCLVEEMVIWGTVRSVKCKIGELPDQRNARLGNCLVREMCIEELSVRELASWGTVSLAVF